MSNMTKPLRRDAARNRAKVLSAAAEVFSEQGLQGSLEEVARRAGVGIGTVYNHFGNRETLIDELLPARLTEVDELAAEAAEEPDAWRALTGFIAALLGRMDTDRALLEALTRDRPAAEQIAQACRRGVTHLEKLLERARSAEALRADATDTDVLNLILALSLLGSAAGPQARQRSLELALDGLRPQVFRSAADGRN